MRKSPLSRLRVEFSEWGPNKVRTELKYLLRGDSADCLNAASRDSLDFA